MLDWIKQKRPSMPRSALDWVKYILKLLARNYIDSSNSNDSRNLRNSWSFRNSYNFFKIPLTQTFFEKNSKSSKWNLRNILRPRWGGFHKLCKQFWGRGVLKMANFSSYYYYFCLLLGGRGVKKSQKYVYVVYEYSLTKKSYS